MRLWSMVVSHPTTPSVDCGRLSIRDGRGRAGAVPGGWGVVVTRAINALDSLEGVEVGDQLGDLLFGELADPHVGTGLGRLGVAEPDPEVGVVQHEDGAGEVVPGLQVGEVGTDLAGGRRALHGMAGGA